MTSKGNCHPLRRGRWRVVLVTIAMLAATSPVVASRPSPAGAADATAFEDVPAGAFYRAAVDWLASAGITTGTSPTTFSPNDPVTRGQMATFLARYAQTQGTPGDHGFADIPSGTYYDGPVSFLVERGLTTGTAPGVYSPHDPLTRAQMATFLWRFSYEPAADAPMSFGDVRQGTYYFEPVRWLASTGITTGTSPTTYAPHDIVTRGQMATFLWRLADQPRPGELGTNRVDLETTVIAHETDLGPGTAIDGDGTSTIDWLGADVPDVGDVIIVGITDETPMGFVGRVMARNGSTLTTEPATLQDAMPRVEVDAEFDYDDPAGLSPAGIRDAFKDVKLTCSTDTHAEIEVDLALDADLIISLKWGFFTLRRAFVGFEASARAELGVDIGGAVECSAEKSISGPRLSPITFWIGPVPVVLIPEISLEIEVGGSVAGEVSARMFYEERVTAGIRYSGGKWSTVYEREKDSGLDNFVFRAQASLGVELRARLDVKAYGIAGPYVTLGPFVELNIQNAIPWWSIDAGLRASVGAEIDLIFFNADITFAEVDLIRFNLENSGNAPFPGGLGLLEGLPLRSVDSFAAHSCGLDGLGQVYCWGGGSLFAARVPGISGATEVTVGGHSCALFSDGSVKCWGANGDGQLGNGTTVDSSAPVKVTGINDAIMISAGSSHTCAVLADYTLKCWGANWSGQLGDGTTQARSIPAEVVDLVDVADIALGSAHTCAVQANGEAKCWGRNFTGQLGIGSRDSESHPRPLSVSGLTDAVEIEAGTENDDQSHTCARRTDSTVMCWGIDRISFPFNVDVPTPIAGLTDVTDLAVGMLHVCAVTGQGLAYCWGADDRGQLGNGDPMAGSLTPVEVAFQAANRGDVVTITASQDGSCAQLRNRIVTCWGQNNIGQLGDGTTDTRTSPISRVRAE